MKDYSQIKHDLEELRNELVDYIASQEDGQDLTEKFIQVRESDVATYELLMLIYQEFKTLQKMNKKKLTGLMNKAISSKIKTLDRLILDQKSEEKKDKSHDNITSYILTHLSFKNVLKGVGIVMFIIAFLFTLYAINPSAYNAISDDGLQLLDKKEKTK